MMKRTLLLTALAGTLTGLPAQAQDATSTFSTAASKYTYTTALSYYPWLAKTVTYKCRTADKAACAAGDLTNPGLRQILVLPTGFEEADRAAFWAEFDKVIDQMTGPAAGSSWSVTHRSQLRFVGWFQPGGPLGSTTATFGGKVAPHPIRGFALSLGQTAVYDLVNELAATQVAGLDPMGILVVFNSYQEPVTANASPPSFVARKAGVAKVTRGDLNSAYLPTHELAHAALNFLDEYVEPGLENVAIQQIDAAGPLALFDWTWGGFLAAIDNILGTYSFKISEVLAANGNDNIHTSPWPATVSTPGFGAELYAYEGGMFFGRGTYHSAGDNLMNSGTIVRGPGDGFGYAHSPSQSRVARAAFGDWYSFRPNDRLRAAGPNDGWPLEFGSETRVMMFDADRYHHFHPTQSYTVQVGWYERYWKTCWAAFIPYPCYDDVWTTAERTVTPAERAIELPMSSLYGLANLTQRLACAVGINEINSGSGTFRLCEQDLGTITNNFLPTLRFRVPYQETVVPANQWWTTYWWRFRTQNARASSGYTGWSSFYRSL